MITLGLAYRTDIDLIARLPEIVRAVIEGYTNTNLVRCGLMKFGAYSLDFEVQYDIRSEDYETVFAMRHAVHVAILKRFSELDIELAYPTQLSLTAAPDGRAIMPYPELPAS